MDARMRDLEDALGHRFERPDLLAQALIHSSTARSRADRTHSNERLEFLGDRVLGLVMARVLFEQFPRENEGALARRHAALVRREALARIADVIGLAGVMVMSPGEDDAGGRANPSLLADACEAVIATLYLDGGLEVAESFIRRYWEPLIEEDPTPPKDAKTSLQEWAQGRGLPLPQYREVRRKGPPHAPVFHLKVTVAGMEPETATGPSKRTAEQAAAEALLLRMSGEKDDGDQT
jgi:ribonuclease III